MTFPVELPPRSYARANAKLAGRIAASGFDFATAGAMAWLSQLAYETRFPATVEAARKGWGLSSIVALGNPPGAPLSLMDTNGFVATGWGATIVAFTGTDPLKVENWLTDVRAELSRDDDTHTGFQEAVDGVWPRMLPAIRDRDEEHRRLFIVGHSLGGALAAIAARRLLREEPSAEIAGVYTFGMPRCGGERFARAYEPLLGLKTYRFVHGDDGVATLPPSDLGYRHVGRLIECPHDGTFLGAGPADAQSDKPGFSESALSGIGDGLETLEDIFLRGRLPPRTQPDLLGFFFRFLEPSIGDHISSAYLHAFGFDLEDR